MINNVFDIVYNILWDIETLIAQHYALTVLRVNVNNILIDLEIGNISVAG